MVFVGAYVAWIAMEQFGMSYWWALLLAPIPVAALGVVEITPEREYLIAMEFFDDAAEISAPCGARISTGWKYPGNGPPRWSC